MNPTFWMDFETYTLGTLVSERRNYNYSHEEYRQVRKEALGAWPSLGYSVERFADVAGQIESMRASTRLQEPDLVERYGKQYAWIAYFEAHGLQEDRGRLAYHRRGERCADVDIDPNFPVETSKWKTGLRDVFDGEEA